MSLDPMWGDPVAKAFVAAKVEWRKKFGAGEWHQGDGTPDDVLRTYEAFCEEYARESPIDVSARIRRMLARAWEDNGWEEGT